MATGFLNLPDELLTQILLNSSTPTFIQLTRTCKKFFSLAGQHRKVILHHLDRIPGEKTKFKDDSLDNQQLFLLLRQRASNVLTGANFTANLHEYIARDVPIDPEASSVGGLDADYVRMALCFRDSADIRQYTSHCAIKEKIKQISAPGTTILKLVQWGRFVSVLCCSPVRKNDDFSDASDSERSESETEMLDKRPFSPTANARLQRAAKHAKPRGDRVIGIMKIDQRYQVIHFDVYTMEDSQIFEIIPPPDMIPRDFTVQSNSLCAILWDKSTLGQRPTEDATVVTYTIDSRMDDVVYEQKTVWPKSGKPARTDADSDDEDAPEDLPERISFFKDGRRIKMYDAGGVVPYQIFSTSTTQYDQYASTNIISFDGFSVHVDTPFFGTHTTQLDEINQQSYCFQHHLCLGVATLNLSNGAADDQVKVLCILRSHNRYYPEGCEHRVSLSRMTHVSANNSTIVARLWGWEETHSNFSGKDIVAVSPGGTRIAIAMWNKILVYPLNPKVLCDEVVVDSSDDEPTKLKKKKKKKAKKTWETACTDYYHRPKNGNFLGWRVAEIRPIVLDLGGAVAHKMSWSPAKGPVTDTEETPSAPIKDGDDAEGEPEKEDDVSADSNANQAVASGAVIDQVVDIDASGTENAPPPPVVSSIESQDLTQDNALSTVEPSSDLPNVEFVPTLPQLVIETSNSTVHNDTQPTTTEPSDEVHTGQVSPLEPQSPTQPIKDKENPHSLSTLGTSAPSSPPPTLGLFTNSLSSNPFSLYGMPNNPLNSQSSKPSTRKKEKGPELSGGDVNGLTQLEKKFQSALSLGNLDDNMGHDHSPFAPPSSINKSGYNSSYLATEAAMGVNPVTTKDSTEPGSAAVVPVTNNVIVNAQEQPTNEPSPPETNLLAKPEANDEEDVATNHSKNPSDTTILSHNIQNDSDENELKTSKRKKRITEDELIVLTDRGIQVWNLGARAKGKRKRSLLKLEEGLRGKLPKWKGKAKVTDSQDEAES